MAASKAIGFLNFKFGADLSGFERAMKKAQKGLKKFGKSVEATGRNMTFGLTVPILSMGAAALKFGSDLQETDSKFNQVFASIQTQAQATAKVFQDSFGLSELAAKQLLSDTGDLLVGFGFTEKSALELSRQVNELAVDLASFTNFEGGAEGASKALRSALVGETESAKKLGIVIRQGTKEYKDRTAAIMKEQGVSIIQAKALNNLEIATAQSQKAIGDFSRTSGDFANQLRIMKGDLVDVASEMGMKLIPFAQAALDKFKKLIHWFKGLSSATKDSIIKWGLILAAIGPVLIIVGKMSIGISALSVAFGKLRKTLIANPWLLAAAAIVIAAKAIYDYTTAVDGAEKASQSLFDLNVNAQVQAKEEERLLKSNLAIARDKTLSDNSRKKAITVLNNKLVGLNETLNLQNIAETNVTGAIDKHTEAMIHQAKVAGTTDLITETFNKLTKATLDAGAAFDDLSWWEQFGEADKVLKAQLFGGKSREEAMKEQGKEISKKYIEGLTEELAKYESFAKELTLEAPEGFEEYMAKLASAGNLMTDVITPTEELTTATVGYSRELDPIIKGMEEYAKKFPLVTAGASKFSVELFRLIEAQKQFNGTIILFKDIMFTSMMDAANSQESFFSSFIENMKQAIKQLLVQLAVMTAINILLGGSTMTIGKAFSAAKLDILGFADGGIISGPTVGLMGEYPGAASNPEVVAPLDKLKSMMGTGNQNIIVEGRLVGNDIYLSNERTKFNRNRTV